MRPLFELELKFAKGEVAAAKIIDLGEPSLFTRPECHGMLVELHDKPPLRYRCHAGHAFSAAALVAALQASTEKSLWTTIRSFQEAALLLHHIGAHALSRNEAELSAELQRHAADAQHRADQLRALLVVEREDAVDETAVAKAEKPQD